MSFVVLCGSRSLELFKTKPGFCGGIYIDKPSENFCINITNLPQDINCIYIEYKPIFLKYLLNNSELFSKGIACKLFEINNSCLVEFNKDDFRCFKSLLKYKEVVLDTRGEIGKGDVFAIIYLMFGKLSKYDSKSVKAIEIGSWMGCSTYFYANTIKSIVPDSTLFCIDTWGGSTGVKHHGIASHIDMLANFKGIMNYYGVYDIIRPMVMDSSTAFSILQENTFDIIFIDGNHYYDFVYKDILNSIKKIKVGGLLMGHDCECYSSQLSNEFIESNKNEDYVYLDDKGYHCGVIKALGEIFEENYGIFDDSTVWYKIITEEDKNRIKLLSK